MEVRYNKPAGIFILGGGILTLVLEMLTFMMGSQHYFGFIVAPICILMGILYLTRPYFSLEKQSIETKALIGPVTRKWKFSSPDDLIYEDGKIFINTDGKRKKVGISRWLAEQQDWNAFLQAIEQMKKSEGLEKQPYAQRSVG